MNSVQSIVLGKPEEENQEREENHKEKEKIINKEESSGISRKLNINKQEETEPTKKKNNFSINSVKEVTSSIQEKS